MREFLIALQFLTRIPVTLRGEVTLAQIARSTLYFPLVGLAVGAALGGVHWALSRFVPSIVVSVLVLILLILLTGGLHLDGFADTLDGLYGGQTGEEILRIMRDSHIGAIGVVGLICVLTLKFALIHSLPRGLVWHSLILMAVLGRWAMVLAAAAYPYARAEGIGRPFVGRIHRREWAGASLIALLISIGLLQVKGLALLLIALFVGFACAAAISHRVGGMTGDTLGSVEELAEVSVLLAVCILGPLRL